MHKLASLLVIPAVLALTGCSQSSAAGEPSTATTTVQQTQVAPVDAVKSPDYTVIDVRTPAEFKAGHLARAENIDVNAADFDQQVSQLPKDGKYLVYCRSGARSAIARSRMESAGFTTVLDGGGMEELVNAGAPKA